MSRMIRPHQHHIPFTERAGLRLYVLRIISYPRKISKKSQIIFDTEIEFLKTVKQQQQNSLFTEKAESRFNFGERKKIDQ